MLAMIGKSAALTILNSLEGKEIPRVLWRPWATYVMGQPAASRLRDVDEREKTFMCFRFSVFSFITDRTKMRETKTLMFFLSHLRSVEAPKTRVAMII